MHDDELEPKDNALEEVEEDDEDVDEDMPLKGKKGKKLPLEDEAIDSDAIADEEGETLPEDSFDDLDLY